MRCHYKINNFSSTPYNKSFLSIKALTRKPVIWLIHNKTGFSSNYEKGLVDRIKTDV